jgi:UDP-2,4-diacetamido-2,4,6-trideoxy-beta-L-altropyranose hydrolase
MAESPGGLTFRPASQADRNQLLEWRNAPDTRAASRYTEVVGTEQHKAWLERVLADPDRHLLIVEFEGESAGQIRFDRIGGDRYEVSVSLGREWRGRGLGTRALRGACGWLWKHTDAVGVEAEVRQENEVSKEAFLNAGFRPAGEGEAGFLRLAFERPEARGPETPGAGG